MGHDSTARQLARWGLGMSIAGARYVVARVPLYRRNRVAGDDAGPDLQTELPGDPETVQHPSDGTGPLFHRSYWIAVTDEERSAEELIDFILEYPNRVTPTEMARFETFDGDHARDLSVGDELIVRLPGPWDGPVRVIDRTPRSFRFVTLQGHMEAGQIEFSTSYDERGFLVFQIDSWARSGDRLFDLLYERFPVGREMQLHMWSQFCQQVAKASGGIRMSNVSVTTERFAS